MNIMIGVVLGVCCLLMGLQEQEVAVAVAVANYDWRRKFSGNLQMIKTVLTILFFLFAFGNAVASSPNTTECTIYSKNSLQETKRVHNDRNVKTLLSLSGPNTAVEVCINDSGKIKHYSALSKVRKYNNICWYNNALLFRDDSGRGWQNYPSNGNSGTAMSSTFMAVNNAECFSHGHIKYIPTTGISFFTFSRLVNLWKKLKGSKEIFDKAFIQFNGNAQIKLLRNSLFYPRTKDRVKLTNIAFFQGHKDEMPYISLHIHDNKNFWTLQVDIVQKELNIISFGMAM